MVKNKVGVAFVAFFIFNIVWWLACMTGLFFLGKAAYDWLQRN